MKITIPKTVHFSSSFWRSRSKIYRRKFVFSQDAIDAQKANQIYRETVEKANVAILEAKKKLEMSRELIEGNELESHDEKIKVMKENQNQGWFSYLIGHPKRPPFSSLNTLKPSTFSCLDLQGSRPKSENRRSFRMSSS